MFKNKFIGLLVVWVAIGVAYLALAVFAPVITTLSTESATDMDASANMDQQPGAREMTASMPYWMWVLPGLCGAVYTGYVLRFKRNDR